VLLAQLEEVLEPAEQGVPEQAEQALVQRVQAQVVLVQRVQAQLVQGVLQEAIQQLQRVHFVQMQAKGQVLLFLVPMPQVGISLPPLPQ
jgi:hypothetical protein